MRDADGRREPFSEGGMALVLRPMESRDLTQVMGIEVASFSEPWSRRDFQREMLLQRASDLTVAVSGENVLGYTVSWRSGDGVHLANVAVREGWRERGIGRALIENVIALAQGQGASRISLEVRKSNAEARSLYEALGFRAAGVKRNYYRKEREDAVVMRLRLPGGSSESCRAVARRAGEWLISRGAGRPKLAIVLGSGMAGAVRPSTSSLEARFDEIPGFPRTSVSGHPGRLLAGRLHGLDVIVLEGRTHLYEGRGPDGVRLASATAAATGAEMILLTSACGGLDPRLRVGDFVVVRDHLVYPLGGPPVSRGRPERTGGTVGLDAAGGPVPVESPPFRERPAPARAATYSPRLTAALEWACVNRRVGWRRGVLALSIGPCYETAAEARVLRAAGADVVSMSAAAEAAAAASIGLEVGCICCVSNVIGLSVPSRADHRGVVEAIGRSRKTLGAIIEGTIRRIARGGRAE